jgi:hypothetical protein
MSYAAHTAYIPCTPRYPDLRHRHIRNLLLSSGLLLRRGLLGRLGTSLLHHLLHCLLGCSLLGGSLLGGDLLGSGLLHRGLLGSGGLLRHDLLDGDLLHLLRLLSSVDLVRSLDLDELALLRALLQRGGEQVLLNLKMQL